VTISPDVPNNGTVPVNSSQMAIRLDATLTDIGTVLATIEPTAPVVQPPIEAASHLYLPAVTQRTGRRFDARGVAKLRVTWSLRGKLPKVLQIADRYFVACQMQQRVQQHRAMPIGQHKAVAIRPERVNGIVTQMLSPENFGDFGHPQWHTRMT